MQFSFHEKHNAQLSVSAMVCCNSHVEDHQEVLFTEWEKKLQWITPLTDSDEAITSVSTMYPLFSFLVSNLNFSQKFVIVFAFVFLCKHRYVYI